MKKLLFSLSSFVIFVLVVVGCSYPKAVNKYHITVLGDSKQIAVDQASILIEVNKVEQIPNDKIHLIRRSSIDILVDTLCDRPYGDQCIIRVFWFYPKDSSIEFSKGNFIARNIKDHDITYGIYPTGKEYAAGRGIKVEMEIGRSISIGLKVKELPKEFELVMPNLKINGVEKQLPILYFKHYQGFKKEPFININY